MKSSVVTLDTFLAHPITSTDGSLRLVTDKCSLDGGGQPLDRYNAGILMGAFQLNG